MADSLPEGATPGNASTGNTRIVDVVAPTQLIVGTRQQFRADMLQELEQGHDVIIDLEGTKYLDTTALGVLISLERVFRQSGRRLVLAGLNSDLRQLFELTKLDTRFTYYRDPAEARAALEQERAA
jgi:anti-sigma B factor antagonist